MPVNLNRKDIVKIFSGNLEGFLVQPLFLSLLVYKSQSSFLFSSMSLPFARYYSICQYEKNVTRLFMHVEFILSTFIFQRTCFMSNAACTVSVYKLSSYLELFYARVYGYLMALSFYS